MRPLKLRVVGIVFSILSSLGFIPDFLSVNDYMKEQSSSIVRVSLSTHLSRIPATCLNHWELASLLSR